jgi:hypothetical protein
VGAIAVDAAADLLAAAAAGEDSGGREHAAEKQRSERRPERGLTAVFVHGLCSSVSERIGYVLSAQSCGVV